MKPVFRWTWSEKPHTGTDWTGWLCAAHPWSSPIPANLLGRVLATPLGYPLAIQNNSGTPGIKLTHVTPTGGDLWTRIVSGPPQRDAAVTAAEVLLSAEAAATESSRTGSTAPAASCTPVEELYSDSDYLVVAKTTVAKRLTEAFGVAGNLLWTLPDPVTTAVRLVDTFVLGYAGSNRVKDDKVRMAAVAQSPVRKSEPPPPGRTVPATLPGQPPTV